MCDHMYVLFNLKFCIDTSDKSTLREPIVDFNFMKYAEQLFIMSYKISNLVLLGLLWLILFLFTLFFLNKVF